MSQEPPLSDLDANADDLAAHLTETDVEILWERHDRITVEVEVRGTVAALWWSARGCGGDPDAIERLRRVAPGRLDDPVQFLDAVRRTFGEQVIIHLDATD